MRFSVVLIWLCLSSVQLRRLDDELAVENTVQPDVWAELKELKNMVVDLKVQLQSQSEEMKKKNAALEERVASAELRVDTLKEGSTWTPKVAFSFASGLHGYFGPVKSETILGFHKRITNVGKAFNPSTGIFTAPVTGVYYFRFNLLGKSHKYWTCVHLFKNYERVIESSTPPNWSYQYTVGGVTLVLRRGDHVYLKLLAGCEIYDTANNHSTFSGFLITHL